MTAPAPFPLAASVRMTDADYPGVVVQLGADWRLSVSMDADAYSLQFLADTAHGLRWLPAGGRSPKTLAKILTKYGATVPGLADACATLPDDPSAAVPGFASARSAQLDQIAARDVSRPDYARVAARGGNMRVAVCPDAASYLLQWVKSADEESPTAWRTLKRFSVLSDLRDYMRSEVFVPVGAGPENRVRGDDLSPRIDRFLFGLPECPSAGCWPVVPVLPGG